ncbi:MAG: hypothetical protein GX754_07945 [Clostridiaceae bacterium]|nr:hypothetical protein [Clostridiaceae bacterium]
MQKAIRYSRIIAWTGIILNAVLLLVVFVLYNAYFDASWYMPVLKVLSPVSVMGEVMMYGGIIIKAVLEYKSGVRTTRRDLVIILAAIVIVVVYYLMRYACLRAN